MTLTYRIKSLQASSRKYGACEVCGKHVSEVHYQVTLRGTFYVSETFGHSECLVQLRSA